MAGLEASVSRTTVAEGENFQVYLRSDAPLSRSDYDSYRQDFDVIGRQSSSQMNFVNGRQSHNYETILTLRPKKTGKLVLPSIKALGVVTNPVVITVLSADEALKTFGAAEPQQQTPQKSPSSAPGVPKAVMQASLSSSNVYEGVPVVYTIQLFTTEQFAEGNIIPPESEDYVLEQIGDGVSEQKEINGVSGFSVTHKFSVTPKKTGQITIPPARFTGMLPSAAANPFMSDDFFGLDLFRRAPGMPSLFGEQRITAASPAVAFTVLKKPEKSGKHWFPATKADIADTLEPSTGFTEGDAVTRVVTVTAEGSDAALVPDIVFPATEDFKQYPSKTEAKTVFRDNLPVAVKKRQFVFIPTRSGELVLPALKLDWFDVKTKRVKSIELPARRIVVAPAAGAQTPSPVAAQKPETPQETPKTAPTVDIPAPPKTLALSELPAKSPMHLLLSGAFLGAACILFGVFLINARSSAKSKKAAYSISPNAEKAADALRNACKNKDPAAAKDALLLWGAALFADKPPLSLSDLANKTGADDFSKALFDLNAALYGGKRDDWDADGLWRRFKNLKGAKKRKNAEKDETVAPLYPL